MFYFYLSLSHVFYISFPKNKRINFFPLYYQTLNKSVTKVNDIPFLLYLISQFIDLKTIYFDLISQYFFLISQY